MVEAWNIFLFLLPRPLGAATCCVVSASAVTFLRLLLFPPHSGLLSRCLSHFPPPLPGPIISAPKNTLIPRGKEKVGGKLTDRRGRGG